MKKFILSVVLLLSIIFTTTSLQAADKTKIGHVDYQELVKDIPNRDSLDKVVEKYQKQLVNQATQMKGELEAMIYALDTMQGTAPQPIIDIKRVELQAADKNYQQFVQGLQQSIGQKQQEVFQPFIEKMEKAIQDVAKENGYSYILEKSSLLFFDDKNDITALVKKKMAGTK